MFGTELNTAYSDIERVPSMPDFETKSIDPIEIKPSLVTPPSSPTAPQLPQYDPQIIYQKPNNNENQIIELQNELLKQKQINMQNDMDTLFDRFASKKKDVFKLFSLSLTICLGISIHFVLSDLIKNYILNNEFTSSKELLIRIAYPISIFIFMWSLKVFNK